MVDSMVVMVIKDDSMVLPSGECYITEKHFFYKTTIERSTIFQEKTHYFDWAIFNSYVTVITRGDIQGDYPSITHY